MSKFDFEYSGSWSWDKLLENKYYGKVCTCGVQTKKLVLRITPDGKYELDLWVYDHNRWDKRRLSDIAMRKFKIEGITSEQELQDMLAEVLYTQYPDARMSYWEELPCMDTILRNLVSYPRMVTLDKLKYSYYMSRNPATDIRGGAVTVLCREGSLEIPFIKMGEQTEQWMLQVDHYRIVYGSFGERVKSVLSRIRDVLSGLPGRLRGAIKYGR